jgi:arylsulfatase A-like enzyme
MQGTSFVPQLESNNKSAVRDAVYYHYYEFPKWHNVQPHYGVRTSRYKLIHYYYNMDQWELFDLKNDPNEMVNLYGTSGTKKLTRRLKNKIMELQVQYKDDMSLEDMRAMTDIVIERVYNEDNIDTN